MLNFKIAKTHPSLAGHFPGNPVIPGVVILQYVMAAFKKVHLEHVIRECVNVKFKSFLSIDVDSEIIFKENETNQFEFQIKQTNKLIARGLLITERAA